MVFLSDNDIEGAKNLKLVLGAFEKLSSLKINFHKRELLLCFGLAREWSKKFVELFGCKEGNLPFWYLGISMHFRKLSNKNWRQIEERFKKNA